MTEAARLPEHEEPDASEKYIPPSQLSVSLELPQAQLPTAATTTSWLSYPGRIIHTAASHLHNNSVDHDPNLTVPLKAIIPVTIFAASYLLARGYIIIEDLVNLRSQPASAFETINWAEFVPHI
jgi:hypothetical protein